jgi:hypothetical protein
MAFQTLLCEECYENVYTQRRTNYPAFNLSDERSLNTMSDGELVRL